MRKKKFCERAFSEPLKATAFMAIMGFVLCQFEAVGQAQFTTSGDNIYNSNSGNVGLGSTSPATKVHIVTGNSAEASVRIENSNASYASGISFYTSSWAERGFVGWRGDSATTPFNNVGIFLINRDNSNLVLGTNNLARLTIDYTGNVGIGTSRPSSKLEVNGDVTVSGNISAEYQDIAEWVPAEHAIAPGTVVIQNPDGVNSVIPSIESYDTRVAGVISANPGIVLGVAGDRKVRVATTGRVKVHVDATYGPIRAGDLLVTSSKEGTAMRSSPIDVAGTKIHRPGTLIGKALEPLNEGEGEILVLLSLQ